LRNNKTETKDNKPGNKKARNKLPCFSAERRLVPLEKARDFFMLELRE